MSKTKQLIIFINYASLGIILPVLNLILLKKGADLKTLPLLIACYSATVLCFELPSGICADLYGRKTVFLISGNLPAFIAWSAFLLTESGMVILLPGSQWNQQGFFFGKPGRLNCRSGNCQKRRGMSA